MPEGGAQNHCTDRAYSGPPKAAVRFTAQGGQILIRRVDLCRMSQALGPVSKTTNVWARVLISADLCRMSQAVGAPADAKERKRKAIATATASATVSTTATVTATMNSF